MKKTDSCVACRCHAMGHATNRLSRHVVQEQITFFCGGREEEVFDSESMTGRVILEGCCCGG